MRGIKYKAKYFACAFDIEHNKFQMVDELFIPSKGICINSLGVITECTEPMTQTVDGTKLETTMVEIDSITEIHIKYFLMKKKKYDERTKRVTNVVTEWFKAQK